MRRFLLAWAFGAIASAATAAPPPAAIDAAVAAAMTQTRANGLAVAVIEDGQQVFARAYGRRNAAGAPLGGETTMYAASLTKMVFAYTVLQLVDEGRLDLDRPIAAYLPRPLPSYADPGLVDRYADYTALDERWRAITPRMLLTHSAGFANFGFLEPDEKLHIHFAPGSRYAYSGDGIILLQFVLEQSLGLDVGAEMQRRVFDRFGMTRSSMMWRPDFAADLADGWDADGKPQAHDERSRTRAAGSLDTTLDDLAAFVAGFMRGEGLAAETRRQMISPQRPITTAAQFPTLAPELAAAQRRADLAAGLGVVVFEGPEGPGFLKGGHDDITGNILVCVQRGRRCALLMSNDVRAEAAYPELVRLLIGETGAPWDWEYGAQPSRW